MKKYLLFAALALLAGVAGYWMGSDLHHGEPNSAQVVSFSLPDIHGKNRSIGDWQGKLRIVNFWATWCPPCREEIPVFIKAQQQFGRRGLQIIGVAVDKPADVMRFYAAEGMNYPVLLGEQDGLALMSRYGDPDGSLPYSIIIDGQGHVVGSQLGAFTQSELDRKIQPYLKPAS